MQCKCANCRFFDNDPARIEASIAGLNVLSSAYASVRADAGICSRHELFVATWRRCKNFRGRV